MGRFGRKLYRFCLHRVWTFFIQNRSACSWLYHLLHHHFWSVNATIRQFSTPTKVLHYLVACFALLLADDVSPHITFDFHMLVNITGAKVPRICSHSIFTVLLSAHLPLQYVCRLVMKSLVSHCHSSWDAWWWTFEDWSWMIQNIPFIYGPCNSRRGTRRSKKLD